MLDHFGLVQAIPTTVALVLAGAACLFGVWLLRRQMRRRAAGASGLVFGLAYTATLGWSLADHGTANTYLQGLLLGSLALTATVCGVAVLVTRNRRNDLLAPAALTLLVAVAVYELDYAVRLFDSKSPFDLRSWHYVLLAATVVVAALGTALMARWVAARLAFKRRTPGPVSR